MDDQEDFVFKERISRLKELVAEIQVCMFCTNLKMKDGPTCRPMSTQNVDDDGDIWFFSNEHSIKNREIKQDTAVQLIYSHPNSGNYLVVNGESEIIFDQDKIEQLWTPAELAWFENGISDPNISLIKVKSKNAFFWDNDKRKMCSLFNLEVPSSVNSGLIG